MIRAAVEDDVDAWSSSSTTWPSTSDRPTRRRSTADQLRTALFCQSPTVFAHVAEEDGAIIGMAIWFLNFSTWTGRTGIALEDLYVRPGDRARGIGRALVSRLAAIAHQSGYGRIDWSVLRWNEPALRFYRSLGAEPMDEWIGYRLSGDRLEVLAADVPTEGGT